MLGSFYSTPLPDRSNGGHQFIEGLSSLRSRRVAPLPGVKHPLFARGEHLQEHGRSRFRSIRPLNGEIRMATIYIHPICLLIKIRSVGEKVFCETSNAAGVVADARSWWDWDKGGVAYWQQALYVQYQTNVVMRYIPRPFRYQLPVEPRHLFYHNQMMTPFLDLFTIHVNDLIL